MRSVPNRQCFLRLNLDVEVPAALPSPASLARKSFQLHHPLGIASIDRELSTLAEFAHPRGRYLDTKLHRRPDSSSF